MEVLNQSGAVIGIATLAISGFVYLYSIAKRGRQDIIRQDNDDLRKSNQEMRTEKAGMEATINETREQNRQLRDIATQTPAVTKLIEMNISQQKQTNEQHVQVLDGLSQLTGKIGDLAIAINTRYEEEHDGKQG